MRHSCTPCCHHTDDRVRDCGHRLVSRFLRWGPNRLGLADPMLGLFVSTEIVVCVCAWGWGEQLGCVAQYWTTLTTLTKSLHACASELFSCPNSPQGARGPDAECAGRSGDVDAGLGRAVGHRRHLQLHADSTAWPYCKHRQFRLRFQLHHQAKKVVQVRAREGRQKVQIVARRFQREQRVANIPRCHLSRAFSICKN